MRQINNSRTVHTRYVFNLLYPTILLYSMTLFLSLPRAPYVRTVQYRSRTYRLMMMIHNSTVQGTVQCNINFTYMHTVYVYVDEKYHGNF